MSQAVVATILSASAIIAALVLARVALQQRRDWDVSATFLFLIGWLYVAPGAFASFTGGKVRAFDVYHNPVDILSDHVSQLTHVCNYMSLALSLMVVLVRARPKRQVNSAALLAALLCGLSGLVAGINAFPVISNSSFTLLVALIATAFLPAGRGACIGAAAFVVTLAAVSGLLTLVDYSLATAPCAGLYKCGPLGVLVFGVVDNENGLSLSLAAGLVFVWLAVRSTRARTLLCLYVLGMIVASGARTSSIAAALLLLALWIPGGRLRLGDTADPVSTAPAKAGLALGVLIGAAVGLALPFVTNDPAAYTFRGEVWLAARRHLAGRYGTGNSQPGWSALVESQVIGHYAGYSAHNQWLDILWISGVGGLAVFLAMIAVLIRRDRALALIVLLPMILLGVTERAWSIAQLDQMSFAYLGSLLVIPLVARRAALGPGLDFQPQLHEVLDNAYGTNSGRSPLPSLRRLGDATAPYLVAGETEQASVASKRPVRRSGLSGKRRGMKSVSPRG